MALAAQAQVSAYTHLTHDHQEFLVSISIKLIDAIQWERYSRTQEQPQAHPQPPRPSGRMMYRILYRTGIYAFIYQNKLYEYMY